MTISLAIIVSRRSLTLTLGTCTVTLVGRDFARPLKFIMPRISSGKKPEMENVCEPFRPWFGPMDISGIIGRG